LLNRGTLIIANSGATLGVAKLLGTTCCANDGVAALINQRLGDKEFICRYINSRTSHLREVVATGNGQPNLNTTLIRDILLPFPSGSEQRAIAEVLRDVDALLGVLTRLIAKKRDLKQAAMQQLLTGQTRLPSFEGDWEVRRFGELFQFLNTANNPRADFSALGDVAYIHYGDIHMASSAFLDCSQARLPLIAKERVTGISFVEEGDLVMADASEDYVGIGKCVEVQNVRGHRIVAGLHTFLLQGNKELLADGFKGHLQFIPSVKAALIRFATGISVYGVSKSNVRNVEVLLPPPSEQIAIAAFLSDMDTELAALEQRLAKTRALKQGMLQELLTGRTRLV
jgi:type I restriction enzyme S subunit